MKSNIKGVKNLESRLAGVNQYKITTRKLMNAIWNQPLQLISQLSTPFHLIEMHYIWLSLKK